MWWKRLLWYLFRIYMVNLYSYWLKFHLCSRELSLQEKKKRVNKIKTFTPQKIILSNTQKKNADFDMTKKS